MIARRLGGLLALALLAGAIWVVWTVAQDALKSSRTGTATVTIATGSSGGQVAALLAQAGVVSSASGFTKSLVASGVDSQIQPGVYVMARGSSDAAALRLLEAGPVQAPGVRLTIPEGLTVKEIAARAHDVLGTSEAAYRAAAPKAVPKGFLRAGEHDPAGEGFLFPATYELPKGTTARALVAAQAQAFGESWAQVDLRRAKARGLTPYDVLIIASLIEREAAAPQDRAKIAAVIWNRLRLGMTLGIDASIQYAVGSWRPLTGADLAIASPYNTRLVHGLPPTPICNPGLASIEAAAQPLHVDYLYYVAIPGDPQRRHYFTASYQDFLAYQQAHPQ